MPASSRHGRTLSPPLSTAYSSATTGQVKLNIVTRVAIEGKARKGVDGKADGAAIKMFLKVRAFVPPAPVRWTTARDLVSKTELCNRTEDVEIRMGVHFWPNGFANITWPSCVHKALCAVLGGQLQRDSGDPCQTSCVRIPPEVVVQALRSRLLSPPLHSYCTRCGMNGLLVLTKPRSASMHSLRL